MSRRTITYQPALDGVRALAVAAVLLFHARSGWMHGGYLGVSVFFTLSGFLITSLLLAEHADTGSVDVGAFYTRRARRLLPASLVCLVVVCLLAAGGAFDGVARLRRDVLGALFQVFNWVKLGGGGSYADITAAQAGLRGPLDHYWSLAVEEQFYWIWPIAFVVIAWLCRRHGWTAIRVIGGLAVLAGLAAPVIANVWGPNAAYWATPARSGEILVGAFVACVVAARQTPARARWLAPTGFALLVAGFVLFPDGHGPAYQGALPLVGVASAAMIYGLQVEGPLRSALSWRPLVAFGRVSYGVYLFHWPIYVLIDRQLWHLPVVVDLAAKWGLTGAVTVASYLLIERPVRRSERLVPRRTFGAAMACTIAVSALVVVVPAGTKYYGVSADQATTASIAAGPVVPLALLGTPSSEPAAVEPVPVITDPAPSTTTTLVPPRPVRIVVLGDSTAEATGAGLVAWAAANPQQAQVELVTQPGCGLVMGGFQDFAFGFRDVTKVCGTYVYTILPTQVAALHPDLVMILTSVWDIHDRRLTRRGADLSPVDPPLATLMRTKLAALTDCVLALGVPRVVWVAGPPPMPTPTAVDDQQADPVRYAAMFSIVRDLVGQRPHVGYLDLAGWVAGTPLASDASARPDKVHWMPDAARRIADEFLGPALVRMALT